jgi:hypothetical protein
MQATDSGWQSSQNEPDNFQRRLSQTAAWQALGAGAAAMTRRWRRGDAFLGDGH